MDNKENSHFDEINALYFEYASLKDKENVENKLQVLKSSIIVETCKMFHLDRAGYHYKDIKLVIYFLLTKSKTNNSVISLTMSLAFSYVYGV